MRETAYAKINLALHVRRRREDGYHELETLFAFVDAGDELAAEPAGTDSLHVMGEFATGLSDPFGNIVAKALNLLPHGAGWAVTLEKRLPVAAGLGGGSADAGAVFRMVERAHGLPRPRPALPQAQEKPHDCHPRTRDPLFRHPRRAAQHDQP
jgi:4-diphosphocytidyl-2-C-methyl-D-erythritol kinase